MELTDFKIVVTVIQKISNTLKKGKERKSELIFFLLQAGLADSRLLIAVRTMTPKQCNGKSSQPTALFPEGDNH